MNICFITNKYPGKHNSSEYAFVKQLVDAFAEKGHTLHVLAPYNILHYKKFSASKEVYSQGSGKVIVYRPTYLSLSRIRLGKFNPSDWLHKRAVQRALNMLEVKPDVMYCHFWKAGYEGYEYAKKYDIPLFVASGESEVKKMFSPQKDQADFANFVKGVVCVSGKNRDESVQLGLTTIEKCQVFPNAVNSKLFHKRDKIECRKQLGLSLDVFIIAFVGWFIERKGPMRVAAAVNLIGNVKSIFIGKGDQLPQCDGILFKGSLPHDKVPLYLGAADCFVLPTLHEGCCNAVVEAMACGLPIISSDLSFNWDVLDETNSIMVDPNNVEQIAEAIKSIRDDETLRMKLSEGALKKASSLTIERRSSAILSFIESRL